MTNLIVTENLIDLKGIIKVLRGNTSLFFLVILADIIRIKNVKIIEISKNILTTCQGWF